MADSDKSPPPKNLRLFGRHVLTDAGLAALEKRFEDKWRLAYEARRAGEEASIERARRESEAMRDSVMRECARLRAECNESIRRQYEVFDRQWKARRDHSESKVESLRRELEKTAAEVSGRTDKGRKLLALAVDPRTPEPEAIAAFLKARAQGIRLNDGV